MVDIYGYQNIGKLYESNRTLVHRVLSHQNHQPIVLKCLAQQAATVETINRFQHEYEVLQQLKVRDVIKTFGLNRSQEIPFLLLEDIGADSLADQLNKDRFQLDEILAIALKITATLEGIHKNHIVHRDICPSNILYNSSTSELRLIDFASATELQGELINSIDPEVLEGTLAYISPEQTGRMNRPVDYRSDLYSLGATLYHLLAGQLPFETRDPMEMIHSHLAKRVRPLAEICPQVPLPVSKIIDRLMTKNPHKRYQSCRSLASDLNRCLEELSVRDAISDFPIDAENRVGKIRFSQRVFGRNREKQLLLDTFAEVQQGKSRILMVSGPGGIGKSVLVRQAEKPVTESGGFFVSAKFEQLQAGMQYETFTQTFGELIGRILSHHQKSYNLVKHRIIKALGENAILMTDLIPELELMIGPQKPVAQLSSLEARDRFQRVFLKFVQQLADKDHPLVFFIDDLHWADQASLDLIRLIICAEASHFFYFICAYRGNEVGVDHPLSHMINEIERAGVEVRALTLMAIDANSTAQLIAETLSCPTDKAAELAKTVVTKTGGNPFFIKEFFSAIFHKKLLWYDDSREGWQYDLSRINELTIVDDAVHLIVERVQRLSSDLQHLLKLAACLGNRFEMDALVLVSGMEQKKVEHLLNEGVVEGVIVRAAGDELSDTGAFQYSHDRIQQAVYGLNKESDLPQIHYQNGRRLEGGYGPEQVRDRITTIVNQLNYGISLIANSQERDELIRLNRMAGRKAKAAMAFEPSFRYFKIAIELLKKGALLQQQTTGGNCWVEDYSLSLSLHQECAEAAFLLTDYEVLDDLVSEVLKQARNPIDEVLVVELQIRALHGQKKLLEAVDTSHELIARLGVKMPKRPHKGHVVMGLLKTKYSLRGRDIEGLADLPVMENPRVLAAMHVLSCAVMAANVALPDLLPLIVFVGIELSLKYGNGPNSIFGYAGYGLILCTVKGDYANANRYVELAMSLIKKLDAKEMVPRTIATGYGFVKHWTEDIRKLLPHFLEGFEQALIVGDYQYGAICAHYYCLYQFLIGRELKQVEMELVTFRDKVKQLRQDMEYTYLSMVGQMVINLRHGSVHPTRLQGKWCDINLLKQDERISSNYIFLFRMEMLKTLLSYLFGDFTQAIECSDRAKDHVKSVKTIVDIVVLNYFDSLSRLAEMEKANRFAKALLLKDVTQNQKQLKKWADAGPMNHRHKYELVEAERYRVLGKNSDARDYYQKAITSAKTNGYIQEEALANELLAKFYLAENQPQMAALHISCAHYCYLEWGANAKAKDLEKQHPQFFSTSHMVSKFQEGQQSKLPTTVTITGTTSSRDLNYLSILKASQALSQEIQMDRLLDTMMRIVIENGGAEYGCLILKRDEQLLVTREERLGESGSDVFLPKPVEECSHLPISIINYVRRTGEAVLCDHASDDTRFMADPYIQMRKPESILSLPIVLHSKLFGLLYLENNLATGVFTKHHLDVLNLLSTQIAISLENAELFVENERRARERVEREKRVAKEKEHIIQDLHDGIGGSLVHIRTLAEMMKEKEVDGEARQKMEIISELSEESLVELRGLFSSLDVNNDDWRSLVSDVRQYCCRILEAHNIEFETEISLSKNSGELTGLSPLIVFNICRESLNNVVKHAQATRVKMVVNLDLDRFLMTIEDNGVGFGQRVRLGRGLSIMKKRAGEVGGTVTVDGDDGTTVRLHLPLTGPTD